MTSLIPLLRGCGLCILLLLGAHTDPLAAAPAPASGPTAEIIAYLMNRVAQSDLIFVRNGMEYDGQAAAAHMARKYEHFRDRIHSPADFIELAASRSLLTGRPYAVILASGERIETADWLRGIFRDYCSQRTCPPGSGVAAAVGD